MSATGSIHLFPGGAMLYIEGDDLGSCKDTLVLYAPDYDAQGHRIATASAGQAAR